MTLPSPVLSGAHTVAGAAALFALCTLAPAASALDGSAGVYFAEPVSGRKVTEYTTELPLGRSERRSFAVPGDCPAVLQAVEQGSAYRQSILDRRIWQKVEGDCRYYRFLRRHPLRGLEDHVSDYDFWNAPLSDLPIAPPCEDEDAPASGCSPAVGEAFGILHRPAPGAAPADPGAGPADPGAGPGEETQCRLEDGLFRGRLYVDDRGFRCVAEAGAPSLRLIAVDFADINGDHVLDAVLRFVPLAPGSVRSPLVLPLTRFGDDEPFRVPWGARVPSPPERP